MSRQENTIYRVSSDDFTAWMVDPKEYQEELADILLAQLEADKELKSELILL